MQSNHGLLNCSSSLGIGETLLKELAVFPKVQIVTPQNMESLVKESSEFRKKVRGVAIGRLG